MDCAFCKDASKPTKGCSGCHIVSYCSTEHQRLHWKIHKKDCAAYTIVKHSDPNLGKQWIASRNLKPGTIVLDEAATFHGPVYFSDVSEYLPHHSYYLCLGCGLELTKSTANFCSKCKWPVCGDQCEKLKIHSDNECILFSDKQLPFPLPKSMHITAEFLTSFISVSRGLALKTRNPRVYEGLLKLQHVSTLPEVQSQEVKKNQSRLDKIKSCFPFLTINAEEYTRMAELIRLNAFLLNTGDHNPDDDLAVETLCSRNLYMYTKASRINHSCHPNCTWIVGPAPDFKIRIRTTVAVEKGDPLTVTYLTLKNIYGTQKRRELVKQCGFMCNCRRCTDPTELGTFMSAIVCPCSVKKVSQGFPAEEIGYLLPEDPTNDEDDSPWKCSLCEHVSTSARVSGKVEEVNEKVEQLLLTSANTLGPSELLKKIMTGYFRDVLHPNHWVLSSTALDLNKILTPLLGAVDSFEAADVDVVIAYCKWILQVEDKINPGLSVMRANLLECLSKLYQLKVIVFHKELFKAQVLEDFTFFKKYSEDALGYFRTCFPRRGEQIPHNAAQLTANLKTMEKIIPNFFQAAR